MCGHGAGAFEACRIINSSFERERRNRTDTWNRHHPQANFIMAGRTLHAPIQLKIVLIKSDPRVQQGQQGMD